MCIVLYAEIGGNEETEEKDFNLENGASKKKWK